MSSRCGRFCHSRGANVKPGNFLGLFTAENTEDAEKFLSADSLGPDLHRFSSIRKRGNEKIERRFLLMLKLA
jgi:hypothetical protein